MLIRIKNRHKTTLPIGKIPEAEFNLTKQMMDLVGIEVNDDFTLYSPDILEPISMCGKYLGFSERYSSINNVPKDLALFRPFRNDRHSDVIIEVFESLGNIDFDTLEINEYTKNGKVKYSGRFIKNGKPVEGSYIKTSPSIAILKMSILAALLMDEDEHKIYMDNLMNLLNKGKHNE